MPKDSSNSDNIISPTKEFYRLDRRKWLLFVLVLAVLGVAAVVLFRPKSSGITAVTPSGAIVYIRMERLIDQIKALRSSKFWEGISQMNFPDVMIHEGIEQDKVSIYVRWRENVHEVLTNPIFAQLFGREAAVALYPPLDGFSGKNVSVDLSGLLVIARPEVKTRLVEGLAGAFGKYGGQWETGQRRYKNLNITSIQFKGDLPTVFYVRLHDLVLLALDERILQRAIDVFRSSTGSIAQETAFQKASAKFYPSSSGDFYADVRRLSDFIGRYLEKVFIDRSQQAVQPARSFVDKLSGLSSGIYSGAGSFTTGKPLRAKWLVLFDPAKSSPELMRLNECAHLENPLIGMVPKDVILYQWVGCLDPQAQYQNVMTEIKNFDKVGDQRDPSLSNLEKAWGLSLERDILPVVGGEIGWFMLGLETGGFFPVPRFEVFIKVKDPARAEEILTKVVKTPVTLLQNYIYEDVKINYVTVPLFESFRPSFAMIKDHLVLATSDKLIKQGLEIAKDPSAGLMAGDMFRDRGTGSKITGQIISFVNLGEVARQCATLLEWADGWFARKIDQAQADTITLGQRLGALRQDIQKNKQELADMRQRLEEVRRERLALEAQVKASALLMEAKDTLAQEGKLQETTVPDGLIPQRMLDMKRSQEAALELDLENLRRNIEQLVSSEPDITDDLKDYEFQKADALKYRYYIQQVVIPLIRGLGALTAQAVTTNVKDGVLESEMYLGAQ